MWPLISVSFQMMIIGNISTASLILSLRQTKPSYAASRYRPLVNIAQFIENFTNEARGPDQRSRATVAKIAKRIKQAA